MTPELPTATAADIDDAVARLNAGELVAIPTETVYGLAGDAQNANAVARVFELKGRPPDRPVIVHLASRDDLPNWALEIPDYAHAWAEHFWPGPLTLVLPKRPDVSDTITAGQSTVACRVPSHPMTLALLKGLGRAVVAPSANRYGHISPTTADAVKEEFGDQSPSVLDGGPCQVGIESTIVACVGPHPTILRLGMITAEQLAAVGGVEVALADADTSVVVPGQVASHYSPRTPCHWLADATALATQLAALSPASRVGYLGWHTPPSAIEASVVLAREPERAAQQLYASLRELDQAGLDVILVEAPPSGVAWDGVRDRLKRASA